MAIWYTDVATNQIQGANFPGFPGAGTLTTQPGTQNNSLFEGPPEIVATYTWNGNEAANDIINIAIAPAGVMVSPRGVMCGGLKGVTSTLTLSIGDNDLGSPSKLPIPNPQSLQTTATVSPIINAPEWVSGTAYAAGNVVIDSNSTPAGLTYTAVAATSAATAPHSAANTVWMPNNQRYANANDPKAASSNVAFTGGTQNYGGAASVLPNSVIPNSVPSNLTAAQLLNQPYQIQQDCWIQALIATLNTGNLNANAVTVFRIPLITAN